jgi:sucrose-6-phosphate hydrolase SacC (GH32 family)
MRLILIAAAALPLASCARYADFRLPRLAGGDARLTFSFEARPQPVLTGGGALESHDVLNPSVAGRDMFYSAFDGRTWRTLHARSDDGLRWQKLGLTLAPDPQTWEGGYWAANGSAILYAGEFWYWYQAGPTERPAIGLARSRDGITWWKEGAPVMAPGPYRSWDEEGVGDPYVVRIEPYFYLFYLGQDRARRQRLGVARSADGLRFEKLRSNPVLEIGGPGAFDENGLGEPAVWSSGGFYWMLYTGRDAAEYRRLGLARSIDGARWEKLPAVFGGSEAWDSKVVCDPTVQMENGVIRVWFGGGDVAHPVENIHGQIGYGVLKPAYAPDTLRP